MAKANKGNPIHYPTEPSDYVLLDQIGVGPKSLVYKAKCTSLNNIIVAVKKIDMDGPRIDPDCLIFHANAMSLVSHPNILETHCSFEVGNKLWIVMPYMSTGSMQSIVSYYYPDGVTEVCLAMVLNETLKGLYYLHKEGRVHRDVKAGNILMGEDGVVKLADFGISAYIHECIISNNEGVDGLVPYWIAPELSHFPHRVMGNDYKADIWSFGICALELARGMPLCNSTLAMKLRFEKSNFNNPRKEYMFSESFKEMVGLCLEHDPLKRPSCGKLLKHPFFKRCEGMKLAVESMLSGLPSIVRRITNTCQRQYTYKFNEDDLVLETIYLDEEYKENEQAGVVPKDPWIDNLLERLEGGIRHRTRDSPSCHQEIAK